MIAKLNNVLDENKVDQPDRYQNAQDLIDDLLIIDRSLRHHFADYVADTTVRKMIRQVELFGFHTAAWMCVSTARSMKVQCRKFWRR